MFDAPFVTGAAWIVLLRLLIEKVIGRISRQQGDKARPLTIARLDRQFSTTLFHQQLDNCNSDPQSSSPRRANAVEQLKSLRTSVPRHPEPVVRHTQLVSVRPRRESYRHAALALGRVAIFERVGD